MDLSAFVVYAIVFFAGLVLGRVWGRASARREGNMLSNQGNTLSTRPAAPARTASYNAPDAIHGETDASLEEEVRRLVAAGNLINAIKLYRERTGCGLKEAKDAVERIRG